MKRFLTRYLPVYSLAIIYMFQRSEYSLPTFWRWYVRVDDWRTVMQRGGPTMTTAASTLLSLFVGIQLLLYLYIPYAWWLIDRPDGINDLLIAIYLLLWLLAVPTLAVLVFMAVLLVAKFIVQKPYYWWRVHEARRIFNQHPATKVAVAGSYGKTTMKHIVSHVLGSSKVVAATSGNYNTPIGLSRFARELQGDEEVLIIELGEYRPGDVKQLVEIARPDIGIITGVNEQHMLRMRTIENTLRTIFELDDYLGSDGLLFVNSESAHVDRRLETRHLAYSQKGCDDWKVSEAVSDLDGTRFTAKKGKREIKVDSRLLGLHQIGPLVCAVALADRLGLKDKAITDAVNSIEPFKLRFEPQAVGGGTVIFDIYNGNPAGFMAGIAFLDGLPAKQAKRRVYVTPGIIELGAEAERVHREIGARLASSNIDEIVLVRNRVTEWLHESLKEHNYKGEIREIEDGPAFYENIGSYVSKGDVILLQNSPREDFFYWQ